MVQDQLGELNARLQDVEQGIQDVAHAQEVRQQVNHVSEQALRLALRTQRVSRSHGADEEVRGLRDDFGALGEELAGVWARVEGAECGLEGMTAALGRVCEELAELRARADALEPGAGRGRGAGRPERRGEAAAEGDAASGDGSGSEGAAARAPEPGAGGAPPVPLRCKVQEVERGLESMAEVVWDLRKQVRGLRTRAAGSRGELDGAPAGARWDEDGSAGACQAAAPDGAREAGAAASGVGGG